MLKPQSIASDQILEDELAYYEKLYGGSDVDHFGKPAVVAFREYLVARLIKVTGARPDSRVLSIGCGVGDTELLIAPRVGHITGIDLSPSAIRAANRSAAERGLSNTRFLEGSWPDLPLEAGTFDIIIAVFFLHHLSDAALASFPRQMQPLLRAGGRFYALEPSARRLSGFLGKLLVPNLMKKYQTENERQLHPVSTTASFRDAGLVATTRWFDFCSTPVAGLFPSWSSGYRASRRLDAAFTACPGLRALSSNFELIAHRPTHGSKNGR